MPYCHVCLLRRDHIPTKDCNECIMFIDGKEVGEVKELNFDLVNVESKDRSVAILSQTKEVSVEGSFQIADDKLDKYLKIANRTKSKRIKKKNMKFFHQRFFDRLFGVRR